MRHSDNLINEIESEITIQKLSKYELSDMESFNLYADTNIHGKFFATSIVNENDNRKKLYLLSTFYCESVFTGYIIVANNIFKKRNETDDWFELLEEVLKIRGVEFEIVGNFYTRSNNFDNIYGNVIQNTNVTSHVTF